MSCDHLRKSDDVEIRLVNLDGESRKMYTRIPDLNLKALADQGKSSYDVTKNIVSVENADEIKAARTISVPKGNLVRDNSYNDIKESPSDNASDLESNKNKNFGDFSSKTIDYTFGKKNTDSQDVEQIQYDLSKTPKQEAAAKLRDAGNARINDVKQQSDSAKPSGAKKEIYIQVGSFSKEQNAKNFLKFMNKFNEGEIQRVKSNNRYINRVLLGPMENLSKANSTITSIKNSGHDAIIIRR